MKLAIAFGCLLFLIGCTKKNPETGGQSSALTPGPAPETYTPRVGAGVTTGSRTCFAIHNANLAAGSPVTIVWPMLPQTFVQGEITGPAQTPCPLTKELDTTVTSYDVKLTGSTPQKLTPFIAAVGTSTPFTIANNNVQADLDQNGKKETFRACSANDGIHLTVWSGDPLTGSVLWRGYYYEDGNPGTGPACTPAETAVAP